MSEFKLLKPGQFSLSGDLTFMSVPKVWEQARKMLLEVYEDNVEIDIGATQKLDSSGLALLVAWSRWAHCNNKILTFRNPTERAYKLIEINKLQDILKTA